MSDVIMLSTQQLTYLYIDHGPTCSYSQKKVKPRPLLYIQVKTQHFISIKRAVIIMWQCGFALLNIAIYKFDHSLIEKSNVLTSRKISKLRYAIALHKMISYDLFFLDTTKSRKVPGHNAEWIHSLMDIICNLIIRNGVYSGLTLFVIMFIQDCVRLQFQINR